MIEGEYLPLRVEKGERILRVAWGWVPEHAWDKETAAKDAIADVLTLLFGPSGHVTGQSIRRCDRAIMDAEKLLDAALQSYIGDAEDYYVEKAEE